jgi:hypothetical protein
MPYAKTDNGRPLTWIVPSTPDKIGVEANAKVGDLPAQLRILAAVAMTHDGAGFIDQGMPFLQDTKEHFQVTTTVRDGADVQGRIKRTDLIK